MAMLALVAPTARADTATCTPTWHETRAEDVFGLPQGLLRSQGVTTDGTGWTFSWQGGLEKTNDAYVEQRVAGWPADIIVNNPFVAPDQSNHLLNTHFGDIDYYNGKIYAPYEDGGEGPINNPEYQHPYIAVYDAKTLLYTGEHYALDVNIHDAGVPWVAINAKKQLAYTAEWDMPHDRINVYDLGFHFKGFIQLHYPVELGADFHLSRIQGLKVYKGTAYATRDDDNKSVFKIDLETGNVTKLFSLNPPGGHNELEGLAIRKTSDGAFLHVLLVRDNDTSNLQTLSNIRVTFRHFALDDCDD